MDKFRLKKPQTNMELYPGMAFQTAQQGQETEIILGWKELRKACKAGLGQPGAMNGIGALRDPPWCRNRAQGGKEPALFPADGICLFPEYSGLYTRPTEPAWQIFL